MEKTVFVCGGAGFIGSNFVLYMMKNHPAWRIVCYDKLTYAGNLENLAEVMDKPSFAFVRGDICDRGQVEEVFDAFSPDIVVNFAAESHVDRSISDPQVFLRTNVLGTGVLLDACVKFGGVRFHQISTDEVYGDLPLCGGEAFRENSLLHPNSPYSASKAGGDLLVMSYHRTFGLPVTVSRCSNNYGPYQFKEKLIPLVITNALRDLPIPVYGTGLNVRDWIHVEDHCRAIDMILSRGEIGEIYNIGGHTEMANIDVIRAILAELGRSEGLITYVADRKGHDLRYAVDTGKISRELGWDAEIPFLRGIGETVRWYVENRDWWDAGDVLDLGTPSE